MATRKKKQPARHVPKVWSTARAGKASDVRIAIACTAEERDAWQRAAYARQTTLSAVAREAFDAIAKLEGIEVKRG